MLRWRRRSVARCLMTRIVMRRIGTCLFRSPRWCLCRLPCGGGCHSHVRLLRRCVHRCRGIALRRRVSLRGCHRRAAECAADRERNHHLLYCLVHCRVPFIVRASPFSRLHKDRTIPPNFLTRFLSRRENRRKSRKSRGIAGGIVGTVPVNRGDSPHQSH